MKISNIYSILSFIIFVSLYSCSTLEKASEHGFNSGYYKVEIDKQDSKKVYADVSEEKIDFYPMTDSVAENSILMTIPLATPDTLEMGTLVLKKQSLDIDITSILLKYRPSVNGLPPELTTDFNLALYAGWRHDSYVFKHKKDPLGKISPQISNFGYDFGIFAGPGATTISPFTTNNKREDEYSGMIIQTGFAGFIESNVASFGIAIGIDYLLSPDREVWIYNEKPWIGFIVGIALN